MEDPFLLGLRIVADNRAAVACSVIRLARAIEPHWNRVDEAASARNAENLLREAGEYLRGGEEQKFLAVVRDQLRMRRIGGFELGDFLALFFCYMPVIRKFVVAKAPTPLEGLRAYDAIERVVLPLMSKIAGAAVATVEETTKPEGARLVGLRERFPAVDVDEAVGEVPPFLSERTQD